MALESILAVERETIGKLRKFLFPLMGFGVITGFNIYERYFKRSTNYLVSYLHSEGDMKIQIDGYKDLVHLLNIFMDYTNAFVIDQQTGEYRKGPGINRRDKRVVNREAITNAWEVPLITVSANRNKIIPSFYRIREVGVDGNRFYLSILIDKKFYDLMYLFSQTHFDILPEEEEEYLFANKVFVNWINKHFHSKKYTDFMKLVKTSLGK